LLILAFRYPIGTPLHLWLFFQISNYLNLLKANFRFLIENIQADNIFYNISDS
jgi:hypothetical protein